MICLKHTHILTPLMCGVDVYLYICIYLYIFGGDVYLYIHTHILTPVMFGVDVYLGAQSQPKPFEPFHRHPTLHNLNFLMITMMMMTMIKILCQNYQIQIP